MPFQYLEGNPQDAYAIQRLGSTFSDAIINMQRNKIQQAQFQQQMALRAQALAQERDQARNELSLRQQKQKMDELIGNAQIDRDKSITDKARTETNQLKDQAQYGGMLGDVLKAEYETDPTKNPDVAKFLRGLQAQQTARIAATDPRNIAVQTAQIAQGRDPQTERMIALGTPATANVAPGGALVDTMTGKPLFQNEPRVSLRDPEQMKNDRLIGLLQAYGNLNKDLVPSSDPVMQNVQNQVLSNVGGGGGGGRVRVKSQDGRIGTVSKEKLDEALKSGYTLVQ